VGRINQGNVENRPEGDINLEQVKRIFANPLFANCLFVDLLGGEPLLVKDLDHSVAYLTQRGYLTNTSTNGLLLAERIVDLKRAGISRINVSCYDANRAVLERDLAKINRVFPVHTSIVLLRSQVEKQPEKLLDTIRFIHDAGSRSIRFWIYRPVGLNPQPEEVISDTNSAYIDFRKRVEDAFASFCLWPAVIQSQSVKKLCPQLWQRINCDRSGNLLICCGTDMMLQGPNSNLFNSDPKVVLNHPTLVTMREQLLDPKCEPPDICKTCNLLGDPGW
jgi:sulfatase maturation enzyme AslB (radical SAM superfamily)